VQLDGIVAAIVELRSGDETRIAVALASNNPLPRMLVSHVVPLLEMEGVAEEAAAALRRVAPANTGILLDAALQARTPLAIRRRVTEILGQLPTQRCANGLALLLDDGEFEVRFRASASLLEVARNNPKLRIAREQIFAAAEAEAAECSRRWRYQTTVDGRLTATPPLESSQGKRVTQGIAYVFTLLLTVLDPEPLQLAIRALANEDPADRGTGLEYLDNVLPPGLRAALWPLLIDTRLALGTLRSRSQILAEIVSDVRAGPVDLAELRRRIDAQRLRQPAPSDEHLRPPS
jgi:hypothetical protein